MSEDALFLIHVYTTAVLNLNMNVYTVYVRIEARASIRTYMVFI